MMSSCLSRPWSLLLWVFVTFTVLRGYFPDSTRGLKLSVTLYYVQWVCLSSYMSPSRVADDLPDTEPLVF